MELGRLNQLMFEAEAQQDVEGVPWEQFLADALADDFVLRRSAAAKPPEDRAAFLTATREAVPATRTVVGTRQWLSDSIGVVTSVVEVAGRPEQFTNTRVFTKGAATAGVATGGRSPLPSRRQRRSLTSTRL